MPAEAFTWATADGTSTFAVGETFESARSMCASTAYESSIDKNAATEGPEGLSFWGQGIHSHESLNWYNHHQNTS